MSESETEDLVDSAEPLVRALLEGTAAQLGPALGVELEVGDPEIEAETEAPEGEAAVLGIAVQRDETTFAHIEIVSALAEIVALSRRMSGVEDPDAKDEVGDDDLEQIGELLKLAASGIAESTNTHFEEELGFEVGEWWRAEEPGENSFSKGPCLVGAAPLTIPGGPSVNLFFRMGATLFGSGEEPGSGDADPVILLLDLDDELRESLTSGLASTGSEVEAVSSEDEEIEEAFANATAIFLSSEKEGVLALCRRLREASETWRVPLVLCVAEPTRDTVISALDAGVSNLLCVPAKPAAIKRAFRASLPIDA